MLSVIADDSARAELHTDLDELAREGARRMLAAALEAEVDAYLAAAAAERDEQGRRLVVRNGHARQREILTAAGAVAVQAPRDYVYCWADGVHFRVRLEQARLCCLVVVGVRADGTKELVALADGERESTDSWAELLRDCRRRGMRAPVVMVGDGALGLWRALE